MDAHDREYRAAAAAICDQTPGGCRLPCVGDRVSFRLTYWPGRWNDSCGRVIKVATNHDGRPSVVVEADGGEIRVLDARLWPSGHMLRV